MAQSYSNVHGEWEKRKISIWGAALAFIRNLRVGQDLTRVPIPAIFFRPYSILEEIGTRALGHFHLLFDVGKESEPINRMAGVVHWLVASAKAEDFNHKPYNPVLGEFHKARIDHEDGSVSYCLAEQTVHHPPCSAFLISNEKHGVTLEGNWIFDVTFHGNSVTVKTLGGLRLSLTLADGSIEVYTLPKGVPDMLIQNVIMGTKYVCWTGAMDFACESTNLRADLHFSYKSGDNIINGSISSPHNIPFNAKEQGSCDNNEITVHLELEGVCGSQTYSFPHSKSKKERKKEKKLFVDSTLVPCFIPTYPEEKDLGEFSSIRLWKEVNDAIINNDLPTADAHKNKIEEAQRARVRDREANNAQHESFYFEQILETNFWKVKDPFWFRHEKDINPNAES